MNVRWPRPSESNRSRTPPTDRTKIVSSARCWKRTIDLESAPILHSHIIDGHAVVPMVLIMEWLCEAALQRNPGLVVRGLDDLQIMKGIVLREIQGVSVQLRAGKATHRSGEYVVPRRADRRDPGKWPRGHARPGRRGPGRPPDPPAPPIRPSSTWRTPRWSAESMYRDILFHGTAFQGIVQVEGQGKRSIAARVAVSPSPSAWLDAPSRRAWLTDPLAIDCAIQLVILWGREALGKNSLPTAFGSYRQYRRSFPGDGVRVVARIRQASEHRAVAEIEVHRPRRSPWSPGSNPTNASWIPRSTRRSVENRLATGDVARVS